MERAEPSRSSSAWTTQPGAINDPQCHRAPSANTAVWLVVAVTVPTILGLLLAVLLDRPLRGSRLYKSAFYMPITLSLVVVGQVWSGSTAGLGIC